MKVFISSTFLDLKDYRQKAIDVMNHFGLIPLAMEFFDSLTKDAETVCEKEVRECDLFIGLYAHRYGYIPKGKDKSITQQEYELAKGEGKDCLCFIVDENHPWKPAFIEHEKQKELKAFLDVIRVNVVAFFSDPGNFETKLTASVGKYLNEKNKGSGNDKGKSAQDSCIPRAPYPYIAHPYALPEHFTGRRAEMATLSNWFFNEKEPVMILEAIGGMGKSAMSWVWLHQEIMERNVEVDGVFWWSFYDEPFESFISHLFCYVTKKESVQSIDMNELMAALNHHRFLLVLDGLERALLGYGGMEAMYIREKSFESDKHAETEWDKRLREPLNPMAGKFLPALCAGKTKTLITTRLTPTPMEGLAGVKRVFLKGLSEEDAARFFHMEGIKGTRAEMEQAGRVYDFHPLMLKLLASSIKRSRAKDINEAFSLNIIEHGEPHKILVKSFDLLSKEERNVATYMSAFRGVFTFEAVKVLAKEMDENRLWDVTQELRRLGFLFYDETKDRFDFHPIMRSFLYKQLSSSGGAGVHEMAVQYFRAFPEPEKIITLEDLALVIELYHHLVKAGKFDDAWQLFHDRISSPVYFQLSAYPLIIDLLNELFSKSEGEYDDRLPQLKMEAAQAWTLNSLANSYANSGQPEKAVSLFLFKNKLDEKNDAKQSVIIGLGNAAQFQLVIGQLSAASAHLRKSVALSVEIKEEFQEAIGRKQLGHVLAFRGSADAEEELNKAFDIDNKRNDYQALSLISSYRSLYALFKSRLMNQPGLEALDHARQALSFAGKNINRQYPVPRDFVQAYWLLGEALIQCRAPIGAVEIEPFDIPFYDDYFQHIVETVTVAKGGELNAAERFLNEALRRCRKTNMVEFEPDILLALARLCFAKNLPIDETAVILNEAKEIAERSGYRLKLADIHLFCGQALLQLKSTKPLLGFTAKEHLQKTKEYAMDVSEFSHLFQPTKTTAEDFYKDIPEYDALKRGLTPDERIHNGYYIAYQIAETLEKRSSTNSTN